MLENWVVHMSAVLPTVAYEAHASDLNAFNGCRAFIRTPGTCISSPSPFNLSTQKIVGAASLPVFGNGRVGAYYENPFFAYKVGLTLEVLKRSAAGVLLLDVTALVSSTKCLHRWLRFQEDIVASSEVGGAPRFFFHAHGITANTGAILYRRSALHFVETWHEQMIDDLHKRGSLSYSDQGFFHVTINSSNRWRWLSRGRSPIAIIQQPEPVSPASMHIRFLDPDEWPRDSSQSKARTTCLHHPFVRGHRQDVRESKFSQDGWWWLGGKG